MTRGGSWPGAWWALLVVTAPSWTACAGSETKSGTPNGTGGSAGAPGGSGPRGGTDAGEGTTGGKDNALGGATTGGKGSTSGGATTGGTQTGGATTGGTQMGGAAGDRGALGPYPVPATPATRGGTITFTNVGAAGWWPRRIERSAGDPACDYKDGTDTWGAHCCMKRNESTSTTLAPFDQEMTLILKAIDVKQLAVYQPTLGAGSAYRRVTGWDRRASVAENLWFTQKGDGSAQFSGDLSQNDCVGYLSQAPLFPCGDGRDYYCPKDAGVLHRGYSGSKLVVFLGSMTFDDSSVLACDGAGAGHPGPWVAFVASELIRDGGRKWNGLCNCYSRTGTVGDGCGEINVFEVVMDGNSFSNREFASTGVRSYQAGHVGGSVCQASCDRAAFAADVEVIDACAKKAYERGPVVNVGGPSDGCPVWRRPIGDRYFFILLDESARTIQVGIVHPANIPAAMAPLLPSFPSEVPRGAIDALLALRLPG